MDTTTTVAQSYSLYEPDFYRHYQEHRGEHGDSYFKYRPAYRYGYDLGVHAQYGAGTWVQIEPKARTLWEARNPGTWADFNASIHYAWATSSGRHECVAPPILQT